jgi:hypothetical protein
LSEFLSTWPFVDGGDGFRREWTPPLEYPAVRRFDVLWILDYVLKDQENCLGMPISA